VIAMSSVPWDNSELRIRGHLDIVSALQYWAWKNDHEISSVLPSCEVKGKENWRVWIRSEGISSQEIEELEEMLSDVVKQVNKKKEVKVWLKEASPSDQKDKIFALIVIDIYEKR